MQFDFAARTLTLKLVLDGAPGVGRATTLEALHRAAPAQGRTQPAISTGEARQLWFERALPDKPLPGYQLRARIECARGHATKAHRRLILRGADAVVFVADSSPGRLEEMAHAAEDLRELLRGLGAAPLRLFQWNKRDVPDAVPVAALADLVEAGDAPAFETVATRGQGLPALLRAAVERLAARATLDFGEKA
jgi:hypothetical protein